MYQAPPIQKPSLKDMEQISQNLGFHIDSQELPVYHAAVSGAIETLCPVLEKYVEPKLPVKYPRTPGYRPQQEENKYNAWYYRTEIQGAPEGPLKGYKVAVKDSIPVAGVPMMHGSRVVEGYVPDYDATVVTRMLDAGATIVGKAVCEDFCVSALSCTSHPFPVSNPHNPEYSAGGSSSGCAALLRAGDVDMAVGGDQGGSVRMPAAWTGTVGLKPTYGLVPYTGVPGTATAFDHCGPMARTVKECALLLEVLAGDDNGLDMRQRNIPPVNQIPKYSQLLTGDVAGKKIGLLKEGLEMCKLGDTVRAAAMRLEEKGATIEEVSIPMFKDGLTLWSVAIFEGMYQTLITSQGFSTGPPGYYATSAMDNYWAYGQARGRDLPVTYKMAGLQAQYIQKNCGLRWYGKTLNLFRMMREEYDKALEKYHVLILPTMPYPPPKLPGPDFTTEDILTIGVDMGQLTASFNGTGHPAISINCAFAEGLPVAMQIVGRHLADSEVLNVAYAYEQLFNSDVKQ